MLFNDLWVSGTPSDMLPIDLGKCRCDLGVVGSIVHNLDPTVVSFCFVGRESVGSNSLTSTTKMKR